MSLLARTRILTKLLSINLIIAAIVGTCIWFAQDRMAMVDATYSTMVARDAKAVSNVRRSNRLHNTLTYLLYRMMAETDPEQVRRTEAAFQSAVAQTDETLAEIARQVPAFADGVQAQRNRTARFVEQASAVRGLVLAGRRDEALNRAHEGVDPIFTELGTEGTRLGNAIEASMYKRSSDLTDQTAATRHSLIGFGVLGMLAGLVCALVVSTIGITQPLKRLVAVLERMGRGAIDAEITEARRGDEIGAVGRAVEGIKAFMAAKAAEEAEIKRHADEAAARERTRVRAELADRFEAAVEQQGAATQEIVRNVAQAATGTDEVTRNIGGVAEASEGTGTAATEVLASASELSLQAEQLNAEIRRFLETIRAA